MEDRSQEANRITRLRELLILDSEPEPVFDSIVALASDVCGAPIALVSLVDTERQWFKARIGLPGVHETPRDVAFCAHAIADDALFEVPDATQDRRFSDNPLVTGQPDIRFYAGAPLVLPGGERVGTLCVIDRVARRLDETQKKTLRALARIATDAMIARRDLIQRAASVRGQFEQALAAKDSHYRNLVEEQVELVSLARIDGTLVFANGAFARHFGKRPEQMVGLNLFDFVEAQDRASVTEQIARVMATGETLSNENRMLANDGQVHWVAWTNRRQRDSRGLALLHSVGRDITDRRLAELALRASQAALARTSRIAGIGGWQLDLATNNLVWSEETRRIHEVEPDFVPTLESAIAFYAPEARALVEKSVKRAQLDGAPWDLELPLVTASGRRIWIRAQGEVEFENGVAVRLAGAFQDVSDRRQWQQRLADNERFVRQVTDALPLRVAYLDRQMRFQFVNRAHCERFGRHRVDIQGRTLAELTGRANDPTVLAKVLAALGGTAQHFEYEEVWQGTARSFETHLIPDRDDEGQVRGIYSTGIDITQRNASERSLRELTEIIANTTDFVVQTDRTGNITYLNTAARSALGIAPDQGLDGMGFAAFFSEQFNRQLADVIVPAVKTQGVWSGESAVQVSGGRTVPVSQIVIAHRNADGVIERYSSVMRDISEQQQARLQLMRQAATLRSVAEAVPASIVVVGSDQRYRFANKAFERWVGQPRESIIGHDVAQVMGTLDYERSLPWMQRVLAGESVQFERTYEDRPGASHLAVSYIPLWLDDGSVDGYVVVLQDISRHRREEVRLRQLAERDPLTGLLNRAGFEQQLTEAVDAGEGRALALLYIDLDHFKAVNDQHGHPVGDQVLRRFAQRLLAQVRPTDVVARLGGDEFAILLTGLRRGENAQAVAEKVLVAAHDPFEVDGHVLVIGASVGVAFGVDPVAGWPDLVARADTRLYEAKNAGRGRQVGAEE